MKLHGGYWGLLGFMCVRDISLLKFFFRAQNVVPEAALLLYLYETVVPFVEIDDTFIAFYKGLYCYIGI